MFNKKEIKALGDKITSMQDDMDSENAKIRSSLEQIRVMLDRLSLKINQINPSPVVVKTVTEDAVSLVKDIKKCQKRKTCSPRGCGFFYMVPAVKVDSIKLPEENG